LAEAALEAGHEVDLLLMAVHGELMPLLPDAVRVVDLRAPRIRSAILPIASYLRECRPAALQVSMWPLTAIAILAHRLARSKSRLVVSDHTILSRQYKPFGRAIFKALQLSVRFFYPLADARVAVSCAVAEDLVGLSGLPRAAFEVIYNPLSSPPPPTDAECMAATSAWKRGAARILAVGSLKHEKNFPLLIRAFSHVTRQRPARLVILGEGPLRAELETIAAREGTAEHMLLPGFATNPQPWYETADVFVLASDFEGFGNVLVEAMRTGIKVVSTDCGGPREILDGGRWGMLVPTSDERALAAAILSSLDAPHDREGLKSRADAVSGLNATARYAELMLGREGGAGEPNRPGQ
jgi:glycosyltransferase involved in cell wall biosynthesis